MSAWFDSLHIMEKVFYFVALPATLIMIIQTIMLFFGLDDEGSGVGTDNEISGVDEGGDGGLPDGDGDGADSLESAAAGLRFVTTRGIIAFLTVAGWTGILCMNLRLPTVVAALIAAMCGFLAMVGIAYLVQFLMGLQQIGRVDYRSALGNLGEVYLKIPGGGGIGKVAMTVSGAHRECDAISENGEAIGTGRIVRVTDIVRDGVLVVEALEGISDEPIDARTDDRKN